MVIASVAFKSAAVALRMIRTNLNTITKVASWCRKTFLHQLAFLHQQGKTQSTENGEDNVGATSTSNSLKGTMHSDTMHGLIYLLSY
jgi:hypothetical protein